MADILEPGRRQRERRRNQNDPERPIVKPTKKEHELQVDPIKLANHQQNNLANLSEVKTMPINIRAVLKVIRPLTISLSNLQLDQDRVLSLTRVLRQILLPAKRQVPHSPAINDLYEYGIRLAKDENQVHGCDEICTV